MKLILVNKTSGVSECLSKVDCSHRVCTLPEYMGSEEGRESSG